MDVFLVGNCYFLSQLVFEDIIITTNVIHFSQGSIMPYNHYFTNFSSL